VAFTLYSRETVIFTRNQLGNARVSFAKNSEGAIEIPHCRKNTYCGNTINSISIMCDVDILIQNNRRALLKI
jgi:hypothetical protein